MRAFANFMHKGAMRLAADVCSGLVVVSLFAYVGACTSTVSPAATSKEGKVVGVVRKPFQDLGIIRPDAPQVLKQAALDLYTPPGDGGCVAIMEQVARLGAVLGPDLDEHVYAGDPDALDADNLTAGAVGSLLDLPFRGIVRWVSGADVREKALAKVVLAGMLRRAFLKGFAQASGCESLTIQRD
jgi:hypothetical protein